MSPRFIRVIVFLIVIAALLAAAYKLVPQVGSFHPKIDTAGKIIYLSDAGSPGNPHVWIVGSNGAGAVDLTTGAQSCADPAFSPDGSQIAYISDKDGQQQVYIMDADGKNPHAITFGSAAKGSPEFSPDGKTLTFLTQGTITALDLQSNDTEPILPSPSQATADSTSSLIDVAHAPVIKYSWSPAGSGSSTHEPSIAAVQDSDDGDLQVLTLLPTLTSPAKEVLFASNIGFTWSPDGSELYTAVLGAKAGPQHMSFSGIVTFTSSGGPAQTPPIAVTNSGSLGPFDPEISPDGTQMLFSVMNQPDLAHQQILGVYLQPVDGSAAPKELIAGPAVGAQWSPDGSHILMLVPSKSGRRDLWVVPINGSSPPMNLTNDSGDVSSARWSPTKPTS